MSQFQSFTCERPISASVMLLSNVLGTLEQKEIRLAFENVKKVAEFQAKNQKKLDKMENRLLMRTVLGNLREFLLKKNQLSGLKKQFEAKMSSKQLQKCFRVMKEAIGVGYDKAEERLEEAREEKALSFKFQSLEKLQSKEEKCGCIGSRPKSISYFQGLDLQSKFYHKRPIIIPKFCVVNPNPHHLEFKTHMNNFRKTENSYTERLEKSYKIDSVFSQNFDNRKKSKFNLDQKMAQHIRSVRQNKDLSSHKKVFEIAPKEENYLLNEIIEHILQTKHKTRVQWYKIRPGFPKTSFHRESTPSRYSRPDIILPKPEQKRSQSTSQNNYRTPVIKNAEELTHTHQKRKLPDICWDTEKLNKETTSILFDKKVQLSTSGNKLSSRRYESCTKEDYSSEEIDSKIINFSPENLCKNSVEGRERLLHPIADKYLSNVSSHQSLKINNSELELISSNDYKKEQAVQLELKYSDAFSSSKVTPKNLSEEFNCTQRSLKEFFQTQGQMKGANTSKISKLIEQEKKRRLEEEEKKEKAKKRKIGPNKTSVGKKGKKETKAKPKGKKNKNEGIKLNINPKNEHPKSRNSTKVGASNTVQKTAAATLQLSRMNTFSVGDGSACDADTKEEINVEERIENLLSFARKEGRATESTRQSKNFKKRLKHLEETKENITPLTHTQIPKFKNLPILSTKSNVKVLENPKTQGNLPSLPPELNLQDSIFDKPKILNPSTTKNKKPKKAFRRCRIA
ncbi:unnamed protein product [Moneuplotes crassus]|uniref:Uncharacterized protein n=1 Tax=Euplotes crassus TaxID=5936 RepID=A0AAD1U3M6_EUPCR|nr:unnamed protein product [Moneuplotes crassus]